MEKTSDIRFYDRLTKRAEGHDYGGDLNNTKEAVWSVYPGEVVSLECPPQEYKPRQRWQINIK